MSILLADTDPLATLRQVLFHAATIGSAVLDNARLDKQPWDSKEGEKKPEISRLIGATSMPRVTTH